MDKFERIQRSIDYIDEHIFDKINVEELARVSEYSTDYFYRIFHNILGLSVKEYVKRRKLQHALYRLSTGEKVIDVAFDFGYETHAGFTKAFKKCFGYPPNLYRLHATIGKPNRDVLIKIRKNKMGGIVMQPKIIERDEIKIVGYEFKTTLSGNAHTRDIPAFWNFCDFEGHGYEGKLYESQNPPMHGEYGICLNLKPESEEFSWVLGVAVNDFEKATSELCTLLIPKATYAVFTTPPVENDHFVDSIMGTWKYILDEWLPNSKYELDEDKLDFEYYDERCHYTEVDKVVMEIYIPIKLKGDN